MSIQERAMLVGLHISSWNAQRTDRDATHDVITQKDAAHDAGRFQKALIPPLELRGIQKAEGKARREFYRLSLPWGEDGNRIIAAEAFFDFQNAMSACRMEFDTAVQTFLRRYPELLREAPRRLGKLYDAAEFPRAEDLPRRFQIRLNVMPVPSGDDFRVAVGAEVEAQIRAEIEQTVADRQNAAQRDLWERIRDSLKTFASTLATPDKKFRDSTVRNLRELARMAPTLSLHPDPDLTIVCEEVQNILRVTSDDLRGDASLRQHTAASVQEQVAVIEDRLAGAFVSAR